MDSLIQFINRHPAVKCLLIANAVLFPIGLFAGNWCGLGLVPGVFLGEIASLHLLEALADLVSYQFFHANLSHIFFNMLFLLIFGVSLAHALGTRRFLCLYYGSGVASGLVFCLISGLITTVVPPDFIVQACFDVEPGAYHKALPMIGASGAVAGVMGAALAIARDQPIFSLGTQNWALTIKSVHVLMLWFVWQIYMLISAFGAHSIQTGEPLLHVAGFAFGFAVAHNLSKRLTIETSL